MNAGVISGFTTDQRRLTCGNSVDSVRTLLAAGVNPCVQNDSSVTAYQMAGISDEVKNAFAQELFQATAQSNLGRVCQMISAGVSVDSIDELSTRNTTLHWAASFGNEDVPSVLQKRSKFRTLCQSGASVNTPNAKGEIALHDAVRRGNEAVVKCLLTRTIRRTTSMDSEIDRASLISMETTTMFAERTSNYSMGRLESWTDLLWPQPKYISLDNKRRTCPYPKDGRLKIYFDGASESEPRRIMQIIQISAPLLSSIHLELDYRGHK
ncbi:unnamed protein product, partial [Gongylonema pulchrum]|uniref:ANK_REP_REGION domain-containing protein n=1 Tax=Gongylonema pulchrum TaxID=637853 RepID=A0A183DWB8_9BILA